MNTDKGTDLKDVTMILRVDNEVIERVRNGEITHLTLQINESNQNQILENIDGNPVLVVDEMPSKYHGCYLYNGGKFPYVIRQSLETLCLSSDDDGIFVRIIGVETQPGARYNYDAKNNSFVEDANGDSCIWKVVFEVLTFPNDSTTYLMRWNPAISSFTEKDFENCVANMERGMFRINWSIYEWEEARRGHRFYMMRVGDENAGIVLGGQFVSDPYPDEDWAGSTKRRMYVDMVCTNPVEPKPTAYLPLEELQKSIPEYEWAKGHSGVLLPKNIVTKLDYLLNDGIE